MTRAATCDGAWGECTALLDYAVACGSQVGQWQTEAQIWAADETGRQAMSDHAAVIISRTERASTGTGRVAVHARHQGVRPMAPRLGRDKAGQETAAALKVELASAAHDERARAAVEKARASGESASAALVHEVMLKVRAAEAGTRAAAIARREHAAGPRGGRSTLNGERQQWSARRKEAMRLRALGVSPWKATKFFHPQCKVLRNTLVWHSHATGDRIWEAVVHKCRCEERRAQAKVTA